MGNEPEEAAREPLLTQETEEAAGIVDSGGLEVTGGREWARELGGGGPHPRLALARLALARGGLSTTVEGGGRSYPGAYLLRPP